MTNTCKPTSTFNTITAIPGSTVGGTITFTGAGGGAGNYTIGNGGTGQIYTTTGTGTANWATTNSQFNSTNGKSLMTIPHGKEEVILEKNATLTVKGKVVINDRDLEERINTIEKVLQIPERDVKLEKKHPKLKKLYDEYISALGKYRTFEAIKGEDE
jgi:hypothetical protein